MAGPLNGYRILELTSTVSGPAAGMILGDQGADIIKIEPPMLGDLARFMGDISNGMSGMFCTLNRNKRSFVLDLKNSADMEIFMQLVPTADVLIENYRPGIVDKLRRDVGFGNFLAIRFLGEAEHFHANQVDHAAEWIGSM